MSIQLDKASDLLECDAQKNPTTLFKLLHSAKWDAAQKRCETYPWEAKIYVVRRDPADNKKIIWRFLPLHAAIIFSAPLDLVLSLIRCYPESAAKSDDRAMIPLHLAFRAKEHNIE
eukprot:15357780-Ditylum_brightwellii.AAC.1